MALNKADTCIRYIAIKLRSVSYADEPHDININKQVPFYDGNIFVSGWQEDAG